MAAPIVLDLETQLSFQEVGGDPKKLKISLVGVYDYERDLYQTFLENELDRLFPIFERAETIIGFNIKNFDYLVLAPYYVGNVFQFPTLDLLEEIEKALGFRVALDDLARATLGIRKSGHGFQAIEYFKKGELEKLRKYCLEDVRITKELYEYGKTHKKLYYNTFRGKKEIPISFEEIKKNQSTVSLSLPFS